MRKSELIGFLGLGFGGVLMLTQRGHLFVIGALILIGTFVWYAISESRSKDSMGPSEKELRARLAAIEAALEDLEGTLDTFEHRQEWVRLDSARYAILNQLTARTRAISERSRAGSCLPSPIKSGSRRARRPPTSHFAS